MNMVEVAYQLRDSVNVIVGSEIEEPFDGWPYAKILTRLTARPRQDAAALARWIVKSYLLSYKGKDETVTQSALDVSRIGEMILSQGKIGREVRGTCGLSIYFPGGRINSAYQNLEFSGDCKWITFLERHLS